MSAAARCPATSEDLVLNLVDLIGQCERHIQERMVEHFARCDEEFGRRVAEGIGVPVPAVGLRAR